MLCMTDQQWRLSATLRKRHIGSFAHIDVAGLGGIMLFLLMLFMIPIITYPDLLVRGSVDLPFAPHAKPQPGALKEDAIDIAVTRDGSVYIRKTRVSTRDIPDQILQRLNLGSERQVYLRADARAEYGDVEAIVKEIRRAGIDHIVLMAETPPQPKQTP